MELITHLDGSDVVVIDARGHHVPAVGEVRVEPDRAVVAVRQEARAWITSLLRAAPDEPLACVIRTRDGRVHWHGPVRVAYA